MQDIVGEVPLTWYLVVAAALFCIGLYGVLSRRNAVTILMGVELILNAANLNFIAFWRHIGPERFDGVVFALIVMTVAACEAAVGLALIIAIYRSRRSVDLSDADLLQG
ncbi:MAG: NADH-quinone oxidoreductase subunit NuoK [Anaerolineae bacterium]|nr:NADH-quinone oxidoreductase subunit NuoK [Anaerolineae bacterium]